MDFQNTEKLYDEAVELLQKLIATPSFSKEEDRTSLVLEQFWNSHTIPFKKKGNNIWCQNKYFDKSKPTIWLNSHHDTVKPNAGYTRNPFSPDIEEEILYGLGSNDAGGCLVSLLSTFLYFYEEPNLAYNLVMIASAEEEISGKNGMESLVAVLPPADAAIVGEPTQMNLAVAEKGLMVLDCEVTGRAGHAARQEGENAIYKALKDINWCQNYCFEKESDHLGHVLMTVTVVNAGQQHNVVPDRCHFTIDVRTTDAYTNEEVLAIIKQNLVAKVTPRSVSLAAFFY